MINQFIYKQLQKLEGSGALTLLWVGISSAIALTFFKVFEFIIRVILGVYQQARQLKNQFEFDGLLPKELPSIPFIPSLLLFALFYAISFFVVYRYYKKLEFAYGSLEKGHKGTGRFTTDKEIKEQYKEISKYVAKPQVTESRSATTLTPERQQALAQFEQEMDSYKGKAGVLVARIKNKLYIDTDDAHSLIVGRTRSGKTQSKVLTDIEIASRSEEKPHMIISSGKYELLQGTQKMLKQRGYKIKVLNLIDMERSEQYNPLTLIANAYAKGDYDEAIEICKTFSYPLYHNENAKEPVWEETAMALVNALILALCHEFIGEGDNFKPEQIPLVNMYNVAQMLNSLGEAENGNSYMLDDYFDSLPLDNPARLEYSTVRMSTSQMRSSIFTSAQAKIRNFTARRVAKLMDQTSFHFDEFIQTNDQGNVEPIALFLVLPDYVETNYIIATTWLQQCYYYLSQYASLHGDRLPKRIFHHFDEFGNMPSFSGIGSMLTVGAGRGLLYNLYIQDLSQFDIKYGNDIARLLRSQSMNRFYILSGDSETRREFSEWLGSKEYTQASRTGTFASFNKTVTENVETRPLLMPDELGRLKEGEIVVERSTKRTDLKGNKIRPYPIFNTGEDHEFEYAYSYLGDLIKKLPITELDLPHISNDDLHMDAKAFVAKLEQLKMNFQKQAQDEEMKQPTIPSEKPNEIKATDIYSGYAMPFPVTTSSNFDDQTIQEQKEALKKKVKGTANAYLIPSIDELETVAELQEFINENKHIF